MKLVTEGEMEGDKILICQTMRYIYNLKLESSCALFIKFIQLYFIYLKLYSFINKDFAKR